MPLVTALLPVRDEAEHLSEALASLSAQTFADFEVLVVDDGSRDGSAAIAEARAREDGRFRVLRQEPAGIVAALERGRSEARGRLIARMDGDDVALPERLEAQVDALADPELAACGGRVAYFPEAAVRDGARRYERWLNGLVTAEAAARDVFVECPLPHPALTMQGGRARRGGRLPRSRAGPRTTTSSCASGPPGTASATWRRRFFAGETTARAARARTRPIRSRRSCAARCTTCGRPSCAAFPSVVIWGAGPVGKSFARELQAQGSQVAAFVDVDPRKIGHDVHGAPVVGIEDAPRYREAFAIGAVAGEVARAEIREAVAAEGRRDGVDFVAVA